MTPEEVVDSLAIGEANLVCKLFLIPLLHASECLVLGLGSSWG